MNKRIAHLCLLYSIVAIVIPNIGRCAEDEETCVRGEPIPVFATGQAGIKSHRFTPISSHEARERLELASGETVEIHHQGCEYYVTTFRFESGTILQTDASHKAAYRAAADMLRQLRRLKASPGFDLDLAASTLEKVSGGGRSVEFEQEFPVTGDGADFLQTQVKVDGAGRKAKAGFVQVTLFKGPL